MSDYKIRLGKFGENVAANFLERKGGRIIDRNFYTRFGEIDLVAVFGDEIVFCEVKTRTSSEFGYPEQAVDYFKVRKIIKAIQIYLNLKRIDKFWRLDVVSVEIDPATKKAKVRWFKNLGVDN